MVRFCNALYRKTSQQSPNSVATLSNVWALSPLPPLDDLFRHLAERPELYRRLLAETGSSAFAARLRVFHEHQFLSIWHDMRLSATTGSPPPELRARFAATAAQGVIGWWLDGGQAEGATIMAAWLWSLLRPLWFGETSIPAG
ncbi:MAG: TetR family transcriptional regulator C-terminal domain-containing protein [Chloroflexota bacterium]|nr:TetR family transcriptional regulator C-terminal domain-containing protein [Chloroflexota bacterium]